MNTLCCKYIHVVKAKGIVNLMAVNEENAKTIRILHEQLKAKDKDIEELIKSNKEF